MAEKDAKQKAKKGPAFDMMPEQQFLLRIRDKGLARRVQNVLKSGAGGAIQQEDMEMELRFTDDETEGLFIVGGAEYPVSLRSLPTVVESYKTLNDIDLVKAGDIGQVLVVRPQGMAPPPLGEYADGVTPPARRARERLFRERPEVDPATVAKVEAALVRLLAGGAPEGVEITDYEEMWDEKEHKWVPAIHQKRKARAAPKAKKAGQAAAEPEGMPEIDDDALVAGDDAMDDDDGGMDDD